MSYSFTEKKRLRKSFAKREEVLDVPYLLEMQLESYKNFLQLDVPLEDRKDEGLQSTFNSLFPISSHSGYAKLDYVSYKLGKVEFDVKECQQRGRVERGVVKVNEEIEIVGLKDTVKTTCTGVEMFRKLLDQGQAGDNVGVLLRGTAREDVERGQVLCKPGSIKPHTKFTAEIYSLSKEEGGRHTPFFNGYRPQFYFRTTDVTGAVELPEGTEMVMPGDNVSITATLIAPIAMEEGLRFAIREGGRTVGSGVVVKVIE